MKVFIEVVEEEHERALRCRIGGRLVWIEKSDFPQVPSLEAGDTRTYPQCVLGECNVTIELPDEVARKLGLFQEAAALPPIAECRTCGAAMRWLKTPTGKTMPLDAEPVEFGGNIVIRGGVAVTLKKGEAAEAGEKRFQSHFVTCPQRREHRRK